MQIIQVSWMRHSSTSVGSATDKRASVWFTKDFLPRYLGAFRALSDNKLPGTSNQHKVWPKACSNNVTKGTTYLLNTVWRNCVGILTGYEAS